MNLSIKGYKITKKQISEYLGKGKRFDCRGLFDLRDIEIKTNISVNAEGSVSVKIGKTEVVCGIKMDVGEPYTGQEAEGTMITTMELLPLSSPEYEYGPPRINAIEISRIIDRGIRESGFIDFKELCIKEGEKVWTVFIDLATINDDGNAIDAGALAAVIALKLARMPVYDKKTEKVQYGEFTDKGLPLTDNMPLTITFHKIGKNIFIDPLKEEEGVSDGRLTVEISRAKGGKEVMINALQKGGETTLAIKEIENILGEAPKIFKKLNAIVEEVVENFETSQKKTKKDQKEE